MGNFQEGLRNFQGGLKFFFVDEVLIFFSRWVGIFREGLRFSSIVGGNCFSDG